MTHPEWTPESALPPPDLDMDAGLGMAMEPFAAGDMDLPELADLALAEVEELGMAQFGPSFGASELDDVPLPPEPEEPVFDEPGLPDDPSLPDNLSGGLQAGPLGAGPEFDFGGPLMPDLPLSMTVGEDPGPMLDVPLDDGLVFPEPGLPGGEASADVRLGDAGTASGGTRHYRVTTTIEIPERGD